MKIMILHPDFHIEGGVSTYYKKTENKFRLPIDHYIIGRKPGEKGYLKKITRLLRDYIGFIKKIKYGNYDIIHVNPSLDPKSFLRDGIFIKLAQIYKIKTITFFRGWDKTYESKINKNRI